MKLFDKFLNLFRPVYHITRTDSSMCKGGSLSFTLKIEGKVKSKTLVTREGNKRIYIHPDGSIEFEEGKE